MRYSALIAAAILALFFLYLTISVSGWWSIGLVVFAALALLGIYDLIQPWHSICRNYPILGRLRFIQESIRPEWHQYFIESDLDGRPYNRNQRSLVYQRAKNIEGFRPFGTERDVYSEEYEWSSHSIAPVERSKEHFRTTVGGEQCKKPYSCSLLNVSSMSFGAISPNAIMALNHGAKKANFAHWTGEGGFSPYHKKYGGDVVWQIGTGYFGCRNDDGTFHPDLFAAQAVDEQVKMIELKISQGAKPGHGGVLPGAKVTPEIAATRKVPMGQDCISPPGHSAFSDPRGLCAFIKQLRDLSGGKPVGFKLCIGMPHEFLAICKAMLDTGIRPDFINIDGGEGGTGAAPPEFSDSLGAPLVEGLVFAHNALVATGLRDKIKIACAGKVTSAADVIRNLAIGADWCNAARGFMMAVGCIQAQTCHTNACPVGVATQDPRRFRALDVRDKSERVYHYHSNTMEVISDMIAAMGLQHPDELEPHQVSMRLDSNKVITFDEAFEYLPERCLVEGTCDNPKYNKYWIMATADSFRAMSLA